MRWPYELQNCRFLGVKVRYLSHVQSDLYLLPLVGILHYSALDLLFRQFAQCLFRVYLVLVIKSQSPLENNHSTLMACRYCFVWLCICQILWERTFLK